MKQQKLVKTSPHTLNKLKYLKLPIVGACKTAREQRETYDFIDTTMTAQHQHCKFNITEKVIVSEEMFLLHHHHI